MNYWVEGVLETAVEQWVIRRGSHGHMEELQPGEKIVGKDEIQNTAYLYNLLEEKGELGM